MWLLLFVVTVVVVIVVVSSSLFGPVRESRPSMTRRQLKTGDIIMSTSNSPHRYLFSVAGIEGGHIMMSVVDDSTGEVKLMEVTGYHDWPEGQTKPGMHAIADRIDDEDRDEYITVYRYKGPHIPSAKIEEYIQLMQDCSFNYKFVEEHVKQRFFGIMRPTTNNKLCCSEAVYLCLVHCGVRKFNKHDFVDCFRLLHHLPSHSEPHDLVE